MDYGGFEERSPPRTHAEHKQLMDQIKHLKTKSERDAFESKHGLRYTVLSELPYIDLITFTTIDVMHNCFLGTTKYFFKDIICEQLTGEQLSEIQNIVDNTKAPHDIGRMPYKIASNYSNMNAYQWMTWCLYFSLNCLYKRIDDKTYGVWKLFVEAMHLYCQPIIPRSDLRQAHEKIMAFCREFVQLYSSKKTTCNIHLHSHLVENVLDYGPIYMTWLYPLERANGLIGSLCNNKRSIEIQLMRSFLRQQVVSGFQMPETYSTIFTPLLPPNTRSFKRQDVQSYPADFLTSMLNLSKGPLHICDLWFDQSAIEFLGKGCIAFLQDDFVQHLNTSLSTFIGQGNFDSCSLTGTFTKFFAIQYLGELYGSCNSRLDRSSQVLASWCGVDGKIDSTGNHLRPGEVDYYMSINVQVNGKYMKLILAKVMWFQRHYAVNVLKTKRSTIWAKSLFEPLGPSSFIPVQRIKGRFVSGFMYVNNEAVRVVTPKISHVYF